MALDNPEEVLKMDSLGMFKATESFPSQIEGSFSIAEAALSRVRKEKFDSIIGCGMGGSAMGLELAKSWLQVELGAPFVIVRDYRLPAHVGPNDLVILASYSGDTEETLSCMVEAAKRRSPMVSISAGGEIERFSRALGVPHFKLPGGLQPRTALGYLFGFPVSLGEHLGLADRRRLNELLESVPALRTTAEKCSYRTPEPENPAKRLAAKLVDSLPVVCGYGPFAAAALRFKQQLNENSKMLAKCEAFPELDHNEIEGFNADPDRARAVLVLLQGDVEPQVAARIEETLKVLRGSVDDVVEVKGFGSGVAQLLTAIQVCDSASLFLAFLRGKDPGPVNQISKLKGALTGRTDFTKRLEAEVERLCGRALA
ncbi:MAG: bifunctional phosphoglucose/phosphomannose isomerase [Thermoproteota archaeon]